MIFKFLTKTNPQRHFIRMHRSIELNLYETVNRWRVNSRNWNVQMCGFRTNVNSILQVNYIKSIVFGKYIWRSNFYFGIKHIDVYQAPWSLGYPNWVANPKQVFNFDFLDSIVLFYDIESVSLQHLMKNANSTTQWLMWYLVQICIHATKRSLVQKHCLNIANFVDTMKLFSCLIKNIR